MLSVTQFISNMLNTATNMTKQNESYNWESLFSVIQKSYAIEKHVDLFNWLKNDVSTILQHDVLVAAWGDFETGDLHYDVVSNIPEVRTQKLIDAPGIVSYLMSNLHKKWLDNDQKWYCVNDFDAEGIHAQSPTSFTKKLTLMNSLMVYGVRDTRGKNDCIYVFFDHAKTFTVQHSILGLLMPHLDSALRRVEYIEAAVSEEELLEAMAGGLSDRENEILHWVRSGKTNVEIGMILSISSNTVKNHLKRIFQKLDVSCRAQAVAKTGTPNIQSK